MEKLTSISNDSLHEQTLSAASNEKSATLTLLNYLAEVEQRRLFSILGFSSMWEYVHKALHYSEAQSFDRVNAMRLIVKVPEAKKELEKGNLSLTTAAKLAAHVRRKKCAPSETVNLLKIVSGKSSREVEQVLCAESTNPSRADQVRVVSPETTRIIIEVGQEFLNLMKRTQELGGHPGSSPQELFSLAMKDFIKRREVKTQESKLRAPEVTAKPSNEEPNLHLNASISTLSHPTVDAVASEQSKPQRDHKIQNKPSRYISSKIKIEIRLRSGDQCEYIDPNSNRRCTARMNLEFDHITPFAANGPTTLANLRHYCTTHNRLEAIQFFGKEKMQEHFKL